MIISYGICLFMSATVWSGDYTNKITSRGYSTKHKVDYCMLIISPAANLKWCLLTAFYMVLYKETSLFIAFYTVLYIITVIVDWLLFVYLFWAKNKVNKTSALSRDPCCPTKAAFQVFLQDIFSQLLFIRKIQRTSAHDSPSGFYQVKASLSILLTQQSVSCSWLSRLNYSYSHKIWYTTDISELLAKMALLQTTMYCVVCWIPARDTFPSQSWWRPWGPWTVALTLNSLGGE
jgi:hypothetical protein